ncbi:MAG: aspartate-semialdehyde dehydrogenase [Bacteroidales bacterium]|nr:aspartate-semialdehyde dehydrogenase [Bacteroidales bacterium]
MRIAIIGVTGLVGSVMLQVLEKSKLSVDELIPVASEKSLGKEILFNGKSHTVISFENAILRKPQIAIFSAGSKVSRLWAPQFAAIGCYVIDNSSEWRMDKNIPLIVPEINANILTAENFIIANPNCSTIQLVMALAPLHQAYQIKRLVISTYQSVTGSGVDAVRQLQDERICRPSPKRFYPHPIDMNLIPHGGDFLDNDYTSEEMKLVDETRKILSDNSMQITATVVRVPLMGGHSESINAAFFQEFEMTDVIDKLTHFPGIIVQDNPKENIYPMPKFAEGKDAVFVGRIRRDQSQKHTLNMWVVSDNLRKGAASNAIQIAEFISSQFSIN